MIARAMRRCIVARGAVLAMWLAVAAGCGGSSVDGGDRVTFTVVALEERLAVDVEELPLPLARVALDVPGEPRVERTTDERGRVVFEADVRRGSPAVTVYSPDHVLVSVLDVSAAASDLVVRVPRLDRTTRARSVVLGGRIAGKKQPTSTVDLSVSGLARLGSAETTDATYTLRAPRDRPFFLLAHEIASGGDDDTTLNEPLGTFRFDLPPRSADGTFDVDLASALAVPTRRVRLSARAPAGATSPFGEGTRGYVTVVSAASDLLVGAVIRAGVASPGGSFDLEMAVADTDVGREPLITRTILVGPDGSRSLRHEPGVVEGGTLQDDFVLPPSIPPGERTLADPIPLAGIPRDADVRIDVIAGNQLGWIILAPNGAGRGESLRIPAPLEVLFPDLLALTVSAQLDRVELAPGIDLHRRIGVTRDIVVRRR